MGVAVILYSALMTSVYMLTVLVRAYFPKDGEFNPLVRAGREFRDPGWKMLLPLIIFAAVILAIGLHSAPFMRLFLSIGGEAG